MQQMMTPIFATAAALLAVAGASKLISPGALLPALATLRLPADARVARALGALEVALGAGALIWPGAGTAAACACAYALFAAVLLRLRRIAPALACGCFGGTGPDAQTGRSQGAAQAGCMRVGLNLAALAVCAAAAAVPVRGLPWLLGHGALQSVAIVAGIGGCVFCAYLCFTALPAAWAAYSGGRG